MAKSVSTVGRAVVAGSPHGVGNKNLTHIYLWLNPLLDACSSLSRLTEGPASARTMCPDILYLIPSGGMNKEYRPICHVYSLGHKLPTGGLGHSPLNEV
jgi:hypothetical protein